MSDQQHTTRHPVADLLTDEMRARVRAATFDSLGAGICEKGHGLRCPLAVALGFKYSEIGPIFEVLGDSPVVRSFMDWADRGYGDPADVYALLGCDPDAARQPEAGTLGERPS